MTPRSSQFDSTQCEEVIGALRNDVTVSSRYFDEQPIALGHDDIVVASCMRNEAIRLPYFLKYYRNLGVSHFLLIDNDSSDDTEEYLRAQPDVSCFKTTASYRGSSAGRLWLQEVADTYAVGRWVLTVDVDELLTFPAAEVLDLRHLCGYLDKNGYEGLFTILLDMYSDLPLAKTVYEEGTDFLDTCPFFETDTYRLAPGQNPPFLGVFGGPRGRMFHESGAEGNGPMMKKIPLVKWRRGFSYMYSTHSHRFIRLADITGVLLHFKFFDAFEKTAAQDTHRGDRRQQADYSTYTAHIQGDRSFYGQQSHRLRSPRDLVQLGVMCTSSRYDTFYRYTIKERGVHSGNADLLPDPVAPEGKLTLRSVAALWPFLQNPGIARYFGMAEVAPRQDREALVQEMRKYVHVVDIKPDHVLLRIDEPALHRWHRSGLAIAVFVGERLASTVMVDGSDPALVVDTESLEPNICRVAADIAGAAAAAATERLTPVRVLLFDGSRESNTRVDSRPARNAAIDGVSDSRPHGGLRRLVEETVGSRLRRSREELDGRSQMALAHGGDHPWHALAPPDTSIDPPGVTDALLIRNEGVQIFSSSWYPQGVDASWGLGLNGVTDKMDGGMLRGWVYDVERRTFEVPVTIYANGRLVSYTVPNRRRTDLDRMPEVAPNSRGKAFLKQIPFGYFSDIGVSTLRIEAFVAGTNIRLRRTPLVVPTHARSAVWDTRSRKWQLAD